MLSFNMDLSNNNSSLNTDALSVFKKGSEKNLTIEQGMSVNEISEVVSDKIIEVVKVQFQAIKSEFEEKNQK